MKRSKNTVAAALCALFICLAVNSQAAGTVSLKVATAQTDTTKMAKKKMDKMKMKKKKMDKMDKEKMDKDTSGKM